jgi:hypothetical protein
MTSSLKRLPGANEPGRPDDAVETQFELITLDYERTLSVLDGVARTRTTMRAAGATVYLGFVSLAVERESWALGIAAGVLALLFAANDAHLSWLYHQLVRRASAIERLVQHRIRVLDRPYDPYPIKRLRSDVERYQFGALCNLPKASLRLVGGHMSLVAAAFYVMPVVAAGIAAVVVG